MKGQIKLHFGTEINPKMPKSQFLLKLSLHISPDIRPKVKLGNLI